MSKYVDTVIKAIQALLPFDQDAAIDCIYDSLDILCTCEKNFEEASRFLSALNETDLPVSFLLGALTITLPFDIHLSGERKALADTVRKRVADVEKAEKLLKGLI